jgi:hypothetical protein
MNHMFPDNLDEGRSQTTAREIQTLLGELLDKVRPSSEALFEYLEHVRGSGKRKQQRVLSSEPH